MNEQCTSAPFKVPLPITMYHFPYQSACQSSTNHNKDFKNRVCKILSAKYYLYVFSPRHAQEIQSRHVQTLLPVYAEVLAHFAVTKTKRNINLSNFYFDNNSV